MMNMCESSGREWCRDDSTARRLRWWPGGVFIFVKPKDLQARIQIRCDEKKKRMKNSEMKIHKFIAWIFCIGFFSVLSNWLFSTWNRSHVINIDMLYIWKENIGVRGFSWNLFFLVSFLVLWWFYWYFQTFFCIFMTFVVVF